MGKSIIVITLSSCDPDGSGGAAAVIYVSPGWATQQSVTPRVHIYIYIHTHTSLATHTYVRVYIRIHIPLPRPQNTIASRAGNLSRVVLIRQFPAVLHRSGSDATARGSVIY